jgi:hypothetical protein
MKPGAFQHVVRDMILEMIREVAEKIIEAFPPRRYRDEGNELDIYALEFAVLSKEDFLELKDAFLAEEKVQ